MRLLFLRMVIRPLPIPEVVAAGSALIPDDLESLVVGGDGDEWTFLESSERLISAMPLWL